MSDLNERIAFLRNTIHEAMIVGGKDEITAIRLIAEYEDRLAERRRSHPVSDATPDLAAAQRAANGYYDEMVRRGNALERIAAGNLSARNMQMTALGALGRTASEPVPATGNPCPVAGCNALNLHYHGRMQYGSATGNPEEPTDG